ncbi:DUF4270 domain-containing protein [Niabella beijingensis]|uniref:DUF4270 domain-containing protein n=1 Tax=Niabella beijingensis TaxID=2872700 RepID=UPI001CC027B1|nr:DUF4270 domain-containing protein [Niabella beijingensis]MBZ4191159.1 DUF4270 domain-containing protein [Niabella beijingensis]
MKKRHFLACCFLVLAIGFIVSCSKINMATELGQGLIPEVDNIHTFDTTLEVHAYNGMFTAANDSFRSGFTYPQLLGVINSDPIFGKTNARLYFQVSPGTKTPFKNVPSKLTLDSVVLVINHAFNYGDTLTAQTINVSEIEQSNDFKGDTSYLLSKNLTTTGLLGSKTLVPRTLSDSISVIDFQNGTPDTLKVAHQLRIRLDAAFGQRLMEYDSTGANDGYSTDSVFRTRFKGFALESAGAGNGLLGLTLNNAQLQVYYRYENKTTAGDIDTSTSIFNFVSQTTVGNANASANNIVRDYNGTEIQTTSGDETEDAFVYIDNTPGTFATLKIPGLATFPRSVIHLAELQMESVYDVSDSMFGAPRNVFLDVMDTATKQFKMVPYVFGITYSGGYAITNFPSFYSVNNANTDQTYYFKKDPSQNIVRQWRFNLTSYVQSLENIGWDGKTVNKVVPLYNFRLYAPAGVWLPLGDRDAITGTSLFRVPQSSTFFGLAGVGRARIAGGNNSSQKMKLRIVYSKP